MVVGDGPMLQALRLSMPTHRVCIFTGHVSEDEKWQLLEEAWFLVHGALHEGRGMAILEAAAVGTPSVALNVPGVHNAIRDGKTGVLVEAPAEAPAEESAKVLAEAWVDLSGDPDRRARMGEEARLWAERFGSDRTVEAWEKLLERNSVGNASEDWQFAADRRRQRRTGDRVQE